MTFARIDRDTYGNVTDVLELLPIYLITPGDVVIARRVTGKRIHDTYTAKRRREIRAAQEKFA